MAQAFAANRFCFDYQVRLPIVGAGMAFVASSPDLAVAVAKAGGLGSIGAGMLPPPALSAALDQFRAAATSPLHVNFVTFMVDEAVLSWCEKARPDIVSFHWGHPDRTIIARLQAAGIRVWEQLGSVAAAHLAVDDGIDAIIVQGLEAGGHNLAELSLADALGAIRAAIGDGPLLLAAGGIADGRDMADALANGADAVVIGTRLIASDEADALMAYKQAIIDADGKEATTLTAMFGREMAQFNPMRVLRNQIVEDWHDRQSTMPAPDIEQAVIGKLAIAGMEMPISRFASFPPTRGSEGDITQMALLAGSGVARIDAIEPVQVILDRMATDCLAMQNS